MHSTDQGVIKLDLNVTNRCNLPCPHCCFKAGRKEMPEMPFAELKKLMTEFRLQGGLRIDITGGEPLMRDDIFQIIECAKELGIRVELVTNGTLLDDQIILNLCKAGLDEIAVSIDGATWESNKIIRGYSEQTYQSLCNKITLLVAYGIKTKINTVLFEHNLQEISSITQNAFAWGAKEHGIYYFSPTGSGETSALKFANPFQWLSMLSTMRRQESACKDKIKISVETPLIEAEIWQKRRLKIGCFMENPWHLQILPDGKVYPCAIMCHHGLPLGDLNKQTLTEIWQNKTNMQGYFDANVKPLFEKWGGCMPYSFLNGINANEYCFVCLCKKFKIEEVV